MSKRLAIFLKGLFGPQTGRDQSELRLSYPRKGCEHGWLVRCGRTRFARRIFAAS